jgi:sterol desaturase/sphingolipid hydroxylase (fatty acid hydroxylase superfamily)
MSGWDALVECEALLRAVAFIGVLLLLALIERRWSARGDSRAARRQGVNLGLVVIGTLILRFAFPLLAVALAVAVHAAGGGLFGMLHWPLAVEIVLAVVILDAAIYGQHRLMHRVPWLWRLHRVHHSDTGFDVTTGVRFHPLEIALSMAIKLGLVAMLGPHPAAVVLFELLLSLASLFTHADFALPPRLDRWLRRFVVTPSMHRIHHSLIRRETDSNYGFSLSLWDRLFRSYRSAPARCERSMPIGLAEWRDPAALGLWALLLQPFRSAPPHESETFVATGADKQNCKEADHA